jgi:hypothetical protein
MVFVSPLRIDGGFALINGLKLDNLRRGAEFRNWGLIRPSEYDFTTQNMIGFQLETVVPSRLSVSVPLLLRLVKRLFQRQDFSRRDNHRESLNDDQQSSHERFGQWPTIRR